VDKEKIPSSVGFADTISLTEKKSYRHFLGPSAHGRGMKRRSAVRSKAQNRNLSDWGRTARIRRAMYGLLTPLPQLAHVFMVLWRHRRGGSLADLKQLERDLFRMRVALYRANAAANLQQMVVLFHHGTLSMIAVAGMHLDRLAAYSRAKSVTARSLMVDARCL
jgi:hypothetical protein